jgi:outer membrane protein OmpA-like peptidoglycan-associated protein
LASSDGEGTAGDPYATNKANLRDTIKWLAGIFAALAAVVIAGTPISGLGAPALGIPRSIIGVVALLVCFTCICTALVIMLRLLRSDVLYPSDIDPSVDLSTREGAEELRRVRVDIQAHRQDFIPDYADMRDFLARLDAAKSSATTLGQRWTQLAADPKADPTVVAKARADYDTQFQQIQQFRAAQHDILAYAVYQRFYSRLRRATPRLLILGVGALVALMVFSFAVQASKKDDKAPTIIVVPLSNTPAITSPAPPPAVSEKSDVGSVYFATGRADVSKAGLAAIERARNVLLAKADTALLLIARTDTVGGTHINVNLARNRADAVRKLLIQPGGIAASRVFLAEVPKSDFPDLTADQQESEPNRTVSMYLIPFRRLIGEDASQWCEFNCRPPGP